MRNAHRELIPDEIQIPCEHTDAIISVGIEIEADPVRVVAPALDELRGVLAVGSVELIRSYCQIWTRWLAKNGSS